MRRGLFQGVAVVMFLLLVAPSAPAMVIFHELLADPAAGLAGDANGDGVRDTNDDEFIEFLNLSENQVDLSGWYVNDVVRTRHVFPAGSVLPAHDLFLVFGGGTPQMGDRLWQTASSGTLGLNNTGETITLYDAQGIIIDQVTYGAEAGFDQSINRSSEGTPSEFIKHTELAMADGRRFSPGYFLNDPFPVIIEPDPVPPQAAVPEIPSLYQLVMGGLMSLWICKKR